MKLRFTRSAEHDLLSAVSWFTTRERHLGDVFLERVEDKLSLITEFPFVAPEIYRGIRRATVAPYRHSLFYYIDETRDQIVIMAVEHDARDPEKLKARLDHEISE